MIRPILCLFALVLPLAAALPPDAADLKAKRDAKVAEIDRTYAAELDKLQRKAMAAGNLQAANEIQKEIAVVTKDPFAGETKNSNPLVGKWKTKFGNNKPVRREFTATHLVDETGGKHPYEIKGSEVTIDWGSGLWEKLTIDPSRPDAMKGANNGGTELAYERVR